MFPLLNLSSYTRHHRKSIYLLTFWSASNSKIHLSSQAPQWNVGFLSQTSSFMLETRNTTDGHFWGLHSYRSNSYRTISLQQGQANPIARRNKENLQNIRMITTYCLPVIKVAEVLQIQLSGILRQINCINILLKNHNQIHLYRTVVFFQVLWHTCTFIICTVHWKELQTKTGTYPLYFFSVGKSKPITHTGIHLRKTS